MMSPFIGAWLRAPTWFVRQPSQEDVAKKLSTTTYVRSLNCGVTVRARIDGLVELDLGTLPGCASTPYIEIAPDSSPEDRKRAFQSWDSATTVLSSRLIFVNSFKACLTSAFSTSQRYGIEAEPPDTPTDYVALGGASAFDKSEFATTPVRALAEEKMALARDSISSESSGTVITTETLNDACLLFDDIVRENLAQIIDLLFHQHFLYRAHRFNECLVGAWSISEQALVRVWQKYLVDCESAGATISSNRRKKLLGRDFTASIIQETLGLARRIPTDVFSAVEEVRKTRNAWIHKLTPVTKDQAMASLELTKSMLQLAYSLKLLLPTSIGVLHTFVSE